MFSDKILCLFVIVCTGYLAGRLKFRGLTLGTSGVMFSALLLGHWGLSVPEGVGSLGLVLFVYCLGLNAGPSFLRMFTARGAILLGLSGSLILMAAAAAWVFAELSDLPADLACGLFAGAMTSTPALAATSEALPAGSHPAVGFGIGYPFGVLGVVLFVQLLPWLIGKSFEELGAEEGQAEQRAVEIKRYLIEVLNPALVGKRLSDLPIISRSNCQVTRVLETEQLRPIPADFTLQLGQHVMAVGPREEVQLVSDLLGKLVPQPNVALEAEQQRQQVVVSSATIVGRSLKELKLLSRFGVTIARITRHDCQFVPRPAERIQFADALTAVGQPEDLAKFAKFAGHRAKAFDETNVLALSVGILAGVLLGKVQIQWGDLTFSLGLAGGPLITGLVLGHFGQLGPIQGHLPRAAGLLLTELGLALFLADAGVHAGSELAPVLVAHGPVLGLGAALISAAPLVTGLVVGRWILRLNWLEVLGGICGGMTSTPGLGVINSKTDSDVPVISYAAVYPMALVLLTLLGNLLVRYL